MSFENIRDLRSRYHSLQEQERTAAVQSLISMRSEDAIRELIHIYEECNWRDTRLWTIQGLSQFPIQRSLEFLFKLAQETHDLPVAEAAVWALGRTHHPMAARFLISFFSKCSRSILPAVVGALGQIPNRYLKKEFLKKLNECLQTQEVHLQRNLILTLGEIKAKEAHDLLVSCLSEKQRPEITVSAIIALGKLSRDSSWIPSMEQRFENHLLEYQLLRGVRTQVEIRTDRKLEDDLEKLQNNLTLHPSILMELNDYSDVDVKEGLKLLDPIKNLESLCAVLAKIDFPNSIKWYQDLIPFEKLSLDQIVVVLKSLLEHYDSQTEAVLNLLLPKIIQDPNHQAFTVWLEVLSMSIPNADHAFEVFLNTAQFKGLTDAKKIEVLNHIVNFGLVIQSEPENLQKVVKILLKLLGDQTSSQIQARVLRGLASIRATEAKVYEFVKESISKPELCASSLLFLEASPSKKASEILFSWLGDGQVSEEMYSRVLRAITVLQTENISEKKHGELLDGFIKKCLTKSKAEEVKVNTLRLLAHHPRRMFKEDIIAILSSQDERLHLPGIIALKAYQDESCADVLAKFLASPNSSFSGRALDSLCSLPGVRPKRLVIDYLRENPNNSELCLKIIRSLEPPQTGQEYFIEVIDQILKGNPDHLYWEGLTDLRERIRSSVVTKKEFRSTAELPVEIQALEGELKKKITSYSKLDESVKSVLRSAEVPFQKPEISGESVDKSASILEYCKAIDLFLERKVGRELLFPKLESALHEFQNIIHYVGLHEEFPSAEKVLLLSGLKGAISLDIFPVHKMRTMGVSFLNGRILIDRLKVLDGLRAWAVILLLFSRKFPSSNGKAIKPLIPVSLSDSALIQLCLQLIALQEARNPAAHRQTYLSLEGVDGIRNEVFKVLNILAEAF